MASKTLDEIHSLQREWRLTLKQPESSDRTRQLVLIKQQYDGLRAKRRRELAGYTYGRPHDGMPMDQDSEHIGKPNDIDHFEIDLDLDDDLEPIEITGQGVPSNGTDPDPLADIETLVSGEFGSHQEVSF